MPSSNERRLQAPADGQGPGDVAHDHRPREAHLLGRPALIVLLALGYGLFVLHLGGSPLGADVPPGATAIALVAGLVAIPVLLLHRRWHRSRPIVAAGVAALQMASGAAALAMSSPDARSDAGMVALGCILVATARARRRVPPA